MTNIHERLTSCFSNVFPDLKPDEISNASADSLSSWDSVTHIILLSAVSEEFGFELAAEDFEELTSFALIEQYLQKRPGAG
jgi:acyl carrier protein